MNHRERLLVVVGCLLLVLATVALFTGRSGSVGVTITPVASSGGSATPAAADPRHAGGQGGGAKNMTPAPSANPIEQLLAKLQDGTATEADLDALKRLLLAADPALATAAIRDFLATGRDARTGLDFTLRPGGELTAPTLRVLIMDVLGRIAKRDGSTAAAQLARALPPDRRHCNGLTC